MPIPVSPMMHTAELVAEATKIAEEVRAPDGRLFRVTGWNIFNDTANETKVVITAIPMVEDPKR